MAMARTMLLHAATHWPDVAADPTTWPLAVRHAVYIHNRIPSVKTGLSPMDLWSKTRFPMQKLLSLHVWGCPVYVLEKNLADGKSIGRWKAKSQRMVYMGYSDRHSSDVPLVLNPFTGSITPQWNVVIDDWFATVATSVDDLPDFNADEWSKTFGAHTYHFPEEPGEESDTDPHVKPAKRIKQEHPQMEEVLSYTPPAIATQDNSWINAPQLPKSNDATTNQSVIQEKQQVQPVSQTTGPMTVTQSKTPSNMQISTSNVQTAPIERPMLGPTTKSPTPLSSTQTVAAPTQAPLMPATTQFQPQPQRPDTFLPSRITNVQAVIPSNPWQTTPSSSAIAKPTQVIRNSTTTLPKPNERRSRSGRTIKAREIMNYDRLGGIAEAANEIAAYPVTDISRNHLSNLICAYHGSFGSLVSTNETYIGDDSWAHLANLDEVTPRHFANVFKAGSKKDPDTLSYDKAMSDIENLEGWRYAAAKEINQLEDKGCWKECQKSEAETKGQKVIPCTWVFRNKCSPYGDIIKKKARICVRGDLMTIDAESYAPVVSWSTIRFFLCLSMKLNWTTVSVDWANAFIQATLKEPMYMSTPRGFINKFGSYGCLRVTQSIYGSKFAPRNWYMHLRESLLKLGMQESPFDKCLLYRKNLMMVLYVDDAGIAAPNQT